VIQVHRDLLDLLVEVALVVLLLFQVLRATLVHRDLLDPKALEVLKVYRVLLALRVSRVFLAQRAILVPRVLLVLLVLPVSGVPLGLPEKTRLVHSFQTTSPR
jgi:hypothetical protein